VAYSLRLNEGFVEALALAHDLGHPPFGHAGEEILNHLMAPYGGFEHNLQGLRIVDFLEKRYPNYNGLNLSFELRESILKHTQTGLDEEQGSFPALPQPFLEAQVVDLADRVAYTHHDIDDGLQAGLLTEEGLHETLIWREATESVEKKHPECTGRIRLHQITNTLVKQIIGDLIEFSHGVLERKGIQSALEVREQVDGYMIGLSPEKEASCSNLNRFLDKHFYRHYKVMRMVVRSERILSDLFYGYQRRPETLTPEFQKWAEQVGLERAVCDYIAGMTDRFAEEEWKRLCF
jgi:dGTPase